MKGPHRSAAIQVGIFDRRFPIFVRRGDISLGPPGAPTVRIAVLSDMHIGPYVREGFLRRAIELANAECCDLAVVAGDIACSFSRRGVEVCCRTLRQLNAPAGILGCVGNHDIRCGSERVIQQMRANGIVPLVNTHTVIEIKGRRFVFAGMDDVLRGSPDAAAALVDAPPSDATIMLCHNPDGADLLDGVSRRIDLMICGHTHGSQVRLFGRPVMRGARNHDYDMGMAQGPHCPIFISAGLGVTRWPIRYKCPPEIGIVTL